MSIATPYRRVLITRLRFIGDIILTTPVIRAVRAACPNAFIAYLGEKEAVRLLDNFPGLDEVIGFDFARPTVMETYRVARKLRRQRFDLVLDLFSNPRSALLTFLSGAHVRVGLERKGRGVLYTIRIPDDGATRTAVQFHQRFAEAVGIPPVSPRTEIFITDTEKKEAAAFVEERLGHGIRRPLIGIHPGATWPAKRWLAERFGRLAHRLSAELQADVLVTTGPNDRDAVAAAASGESPPPALLPVMDLRRLAAIISLCDAYVSNDAGPMHIAAAVGTPTVGLFGPGEEHIWFPYDPADGHHALRRDVPCHPCHLDFCNRTGDGFMECMKLLTVNDVFEAVKLALQTRSRPPVH